jgi:hypothetical protein
MVCFRASFTFTYLYSQKPTISLTHAFLTCKETHHLPSSDCNKRLYTCRCNVKAYGIFEAKNTSVMAACYAMCSLHLKATLISGLYAEFVASSAILCFGLRMSEFLQLDRKPSVARSQIRRTTLQFDTT